MKSPWGERPQCIRRHTSWSPVIQSPVWEDVIEIRSRPQWLISVCVVLRCGAGTKVFTPVDSIVVAIVADKDYQLRESPVRMYVFMYPYGGNDSTYVFVCAVRSRVASNLA